MGRVPIDTTRRPTQKATGSPVVPPSNFGQAEIAASRQQGQVIGAGVEGIGRTLEFYAQKHKRIDMEADAAGFEKYAKVRITQARADATKENDLERIAEIYKTAESDISDYVGGTNEQTGAANIRWADHEDMIRNQVEGIKGDFEAEIIRKQLEINTADTNRRLMGGIETDIETGDYSGIKSKAAALRDNGYWTPAQYDGKVKELYETADKYQSNLRLEQMKGSDPETAEAMHSAIMKDIDTGMAFENLGPADKEKLKNDSAAVLSSVLQRDAMRRKQVEKAIEEIKYNGAVAAVDKITEGGADIEEASGIIAQAHGEGGAASWLKELGDAQDRGDGIPADNPDIVYSQGLSDYQFRVRNYKPADDKDGSKLMALTAESYAYGKLGQIHRDQLKRKVHGDGVGGMSADEFDILGRKVSNEVQKALERTGTGKGMPRWMKWTGPGAVANVFMKKDKPPEAFDRTIKTGGTEKNPVMMSEVEINLISFAERIAKEGNLNLNQTLEVLYEFPQFKALRETNNLNTYLENIYKADLSGSFISNTKAPWDN